MANPHLLRVARRLKEARERSGLTQQQLSAELGFKDRQTLAAIEAGERRISADELARAAEVLGVAVDYFTDAFRLDGEARFSFRAKNIDPAALDAFEERAGRWIAMYRELGAQEGLPQPRIGTKLELSDRSSYEDAHACAEELHSRWSLGDVPAAALGDAIQRELGALVLNVDAPEGLSGAASQLPGLHAILINRREPVGRRSYDLGHELFHVLTWDAMPPQRVEPWEPRATKGKRVEELAENFAAALLMPAAMIAARWKSRGTADLAEWVNASATALRVSGPAVVWRLHNLGFITKNEAVVQGRLASGGTWRTRDPLPPLFSREFISRVHTAVEAGRLSLRRAARLLDIDVADFAEICRSYGLSLSYEV
ncbi:MAG TPA: helix-turn-helix transcriptional regulator [Longimicrobium sp.]